MRTILSLAWLFLLSFDIRSAERVSDAELRLEKTGQILDADTNSGVPNASVIALWRQDGDGWHGSRSACIFERFTRTDSQGRYVIPDITGEIKLAERTSTKNPSNSEKGWLDFSWRLLIYKPGYIRVTDVGELAMRPLWSTPTLTSDRKYYNQAEQTVFFSWSLVPPDVIVNSDSVSVKPIRLLKKNLSYDAQIVYYQRLLSTVEACEAEERSEEFSELKHEIARAVRYKPCEIGKDTVIHADIVKDYAYLNASAELNTKLVAAGIYRAPGQSLWRDASAEVLCQAARSEAK